MGGDLGPVEAVEAVRIVLGNGDDFDPITLVGDQAELAPLLAAAGLGGHPKITVLHASEVIGMDEKPMLALKRKKDASMVRAIELVKNGEASVAVSSGNTGALMAGATLRLRMMDGIDRPALGAVVPRDKGFFVLIDAGANPESTADNLVHNAILGSNYAHVIFGLPAPRVGLLTIGTEEGKGGKLITETHARLEKINGVINYVGLIEGFQVFRDEVDVVVCDGFVGNTLLKTWESLAKFITGLLKDELKLNPVRLTGAVLAKGAFDTLKARMNPDRYGGAPLLGVRGNVLKAHGSSNRHAWASAIRAAEKIIRQDMYHRTEQDVAKAAAVLHPPAEVPAN